MALFNKHNKFPRYPKSSSISSLPKYESQTDDGFDKQNYYEEMKDEHEEAKKPDFFPNMKEYELEKPAFPTLGEDFNIPLRRPDKFELRTPEVKEETPEESFMSEMAQKSYVPERFSSPMAGSGSEPIYVRLEEYRKAVKNIAMIRDKLDNAEELLTEILQIKKEEDDQISAWHKEITEIKNKLMEVDKDLFEVHR